MKCRVKTFWTHNFNQKTESYIRSASDKEQNRLSNEPMYFNMQDQPKSLLDQQEVYKTYHNRMLKV